jgi:hypothetical protein
MVTGSLYKCPKCGQPAVGCVADSPCARCKPFDAKAFFKAQRAEEQDSEPQYNEGPFDEDRLKRDYAMMGNYVYTAVHDAMAQYELRGYNVHHLAQRCIEKVEAECRAWIDGQRETFARRKK